MNRASSACVHAAGSAPAWALAVTLGGSLLGLGSTAVAAEAGAASAPAAPVAHAELHQIQINSLGFPAGAAKWAVVPDVAATDFTVVDAGSGRVALRGKLTPASTWPQAAATVKLADLSALRQPGTYRLRVKGAEDSAPFAIGDQVYVPLAAAAIRAYYFNRASIEITPALGGVYARPAGHPDTRVLIHASAAGPKRKAGDVISSPKGWYDAGDYNKYVVNSGISVYTLLAAAEQFPAFFDALRVGLPETGNGLPDVLNEALWNIDWMLTMQDPDDGGVYHKLTNLRFDAMMMPHLATADRYVVQKTTAAALDFAAVMAVASRVLQPYEQQSPGRSARLRAAALAAWDWARQHPVVVYQQPADVETGTYDDNKLEDEFAWAATELFLTTGEQRFRDAIPLGELSITVPSWPDVRGLAWMSLGQHLAQLSEADRVIVAQRLRTLGEQLTLRWRQSAWRVPMNAADFHWGSNSVALNEAMMLTQAARLYPVGDPRRTDALAAAQSTLDYVLGRNPLGRSQVTGIGLRPPLHPHHRPSQADGVDAPVPGFLVGGSNPGQEDKQGCVVPYPSKLAALSWLDHTCSYASNEVAINWNAPLVFAAGALQALGNEASAATPAATKNDKTRDKPRDKPRGTPNDTPHDQTTGARADQKGTR